MQHPDTHRQALAEHGYTIIDRFFDATAIAAIIQTMEQADTDRPAFRKSSELFAIRRFLQEAPAVVPQLFTEAFRSLLAGLAGGQYFVVKSIYFDKPGTSNRFVAYHQDLTISVQEKAQVDGYGPWSARQGQCSVQPPVQLLQGNFTLRIHLDDTMAANSALRVIPGSHRKGSYRPEAIDWPQEREAICAVPCGGLMVMRPLLLHASGRSTNGARRRVIHIECSSTRLPAPLQWSEQLFIHNPTL